MPHFLRLLLWLLSGVVLLCVLAVVLLSTINLSWAAPWVSQQLAKGLHRQVHIDGALYLDWGRIDRHDGWRGQIPMPIVRVHEVSVGNTDWASGGEQMAQAGFLRLHLDAFSLTKRAVRISDLGVRDGQITLERRIDGINNWTFGDPQADGGTSGWQFAVDRLMLADARLRVLDEKRQMDVTLAVSTTDDDVFQTRWVARGQFHGVEVQGQGHAGGVLALQDGGGGFPVQGELSVGDTVLKAEGSITRPRELAAITLELELSGPTMADLYPILGIALPNTPPYKTAGLLKGSLETSENRWVYEDFSGTVGDSDLRGTVTYQQGQPRPVLTAELTSSLLRFEDLGPLIGAPAPDDVASSSDDTGAGDASPVDAGQADAVTPPADRGSSGADGQITHPGPQPADKALPVQDVDRNAWRTMDAEVSFSGERIESALDLPLDDVRAHVLLNDGVLRFEPLDFGVAGGNLESVLTLDGNQAPIQAKLDLQARGLQLARLFPGVESMDAALGAVHGDASLTGYGNSVSELLSHASGQLSAVVTRGTVSRFLLEAAGLNVANMVFVKIFGDEQVVLQCLVADFKITDGVVQTETFILETEDAVVTAEGTVNIATEEMDIDVHPDNKSLRVFTLRSPLYVAGTFKNPDVGVQKGPVAARAGAAVVLGVVATPLAALLPLLNIGTDDETTCSVQGAD